MGRGGEGAQVEGPQARRGREGTLGEDGQGVVCRDGDVAVVTALVELYAEALDEGDTETARLAERIIWHQTADLEVFYPAALLVAASLRAPAYPVEPIALRLGPGPLYGSEMLPMRLPPTLELLRSPWATMVKCGSLSARKVTPPSSAEALDREK